MTAPISGLGRRISWRRKLAYALGSILFLLLACEVALRISKPPIFRFTDDYVSTHQYQDWFETDLRPNSSADFDHHLSDGFPYWQFRLSVNSAGLRSEAKDDPPPKRAGRPIVHCIGDSMTMGWGVQFAESYPNYLQNILGNDYQVINVGVDGTGLLAADRKSQIVAEELQPEIIVYSFCENDFEDDLETEQVMQRSPLMHSFSRSWRFVQERSMVARIPVVCLLWLAIPSNRDQAELMTNAVIPANEEFEREVIAIKDIPENPTTRALAALRSRCREQNRRLIVVILRMGTPIAREFASYCRKIGQPYITLGLEKKRILTGDFHLKPEGNEELARMVAREIQAPSRSSP